MKLIRGDDEKLFQVGIADLLPISQKKQNIMKSVRQHRLKLTTPAEKKLCFGLQVLVWSTGGIARYQREKIVHISDMLSRSVDFYFSCSKLGIEVDGESHNTEIQSAKDKWTDELMLIHDKIFVLRFTNKEVLSNVGFVMSKIAKELMERHNWPRSLRIRFQKFFAYASDNNRWNELVQQFLANRNSTTKQ